MAVLGQFASEEAREAGRKGGMASHRRRQDQSPEPQGREDIAASGSESDQMIGRGDDDAPYGRSDEM